MHIALKRFGTVEEGERMVREGGVGIPTHLGHEVLLLAVPLLSVNAPANTGCELHYLLYQADRRPAGEVTNIAIGEDPSPQKLL